MEIVKLQKHVNRIDNQKEIDQEKAQEIMMKRKWKRWISKKTEKIGLSRKS